MSNKYHTTYYCRWWLRICCFFALRVWNTRVTMFLIIFVIFCTQEISHGLCLDIFAHRLLVVGYAQHALSDTKTIDTDVCTTRPPSTWLIAAHQSQTLPADDIHVTGSVLLVVGPSLSQVRRSGIHYRTVSVTRRSAVIVSDNYWRRTYSSVTTEYTQRSRDASWLCAI